MPTVKDFETKYIELKDKFKYWKQDFFLILLDYYKNYKKTNKLIPTQNVLEWTSKYQQERDLYLFFLTEKLSTCLRPAKGV